MAGFVVKNNAESLVADNPLASGATTLNVTSGEGDNFPSTFPYRLTIWDDENHADPTDDSGMEIVECTGRSGDALTIVRGKEGTSDVDHANGERVAMLITAGLFNDSTYGIMTLISEAPLITKSIADIATAINGSGTDSVPAGMINGWSASLSASIFDDTNLTASKSASIFNDTNLTVSKSASIFNDTNLTAAKAASIIDSTNLTAAKAASICAEAGLTQSRFNSIFDDTSLTDARISSILNDSNFTGKAQKGQECFDAMSRSKASFINGDHICELLDDWSDNKLTSRDNAATTATGFTDRFGKTFRPEWTVDSGTWTGNAEVMKKTNGGSAGAVYVSSTYTTGTWSVKLQNQSTSNVISDFCFMWVDASNMNFYRMSTNPTLQLVKKVSDTDTALIDSGWTADTAWHTCKVTRDASGNFEMFFDGVSKGTATDTDITTSNQIRQNNLHSADGNVWVDDLKVY